MENNIVDFPKKLNDQIAVKCWMLNNEIAVALSRYHEEEQFVSIVGVLLEMLKRNPTLKPALLQLLERKQDDKG